MTKVFISYSRKDKEFAARFTGALQQSELETWIDWEDIPPTADWLDQIHKGIEQADGFLFLLSPDSIVSKVCEQEVEHAVQNGKRLIPIVVREINPGEVHPALAKVNWVYAREQDDFTVAVNKTLSAIRTDLAWVEAHRRLQVRAIEWEKRKELSLLLRGKDLQEAEEQLASAGQKDPVPTDLQRQFVLNSRREESSSRNRLISIGGVAILVMLGLLIFALFQLNIARAQKLGFQAQTTFVEQSYNAAALYAYQSNQIYENEAADLVNEQLAKYKLPETRGLIGHAFWVTDVAWSNAGQLASASLDKVIIWDLAKREPQKVLRDSDADPQLSLAWSPDGLLASGSFLGKINIWNPETGAIQKKLDSGSGGISRIAWSPNGDLASVAWDGTVAIWDVQNEKAIRVFKDDRFTNLAWSPDGKLATGSSGGNIMLWDITQEKALQTLQFKGGGVTSLAWSATGELASGSDNGTVTIWDTATGKPKYTLTSPASMVIHKRASMGNVNLNDQPRVIGSLAWSPDGELTSGSYDGTIVIWNLATPNASQILREHTNGITSLAWSRQGELASGSVDTTVNVYSLQMNNIDQNTRLCEILFRNMTFSEWIDYQGWLFVYQPACPNLPHEKMDFSNTKELVMILATEPEMMILTWNGRLLVIGGILATLAIFYRLIRLIFGVGNLLKRRYTQRGQ